MKKLTFIFALLFSGSLLIAQPVVDNAVIPVSVSLNSILRLNVTSGGNIEFVVSTLAQYGSGITGIGNPRYQTNFTVASSVDFDVQISSETATLNGTTAGNTMLMNNLGYSLGMAVGATGTAGIGGTTGFNYELTPNETLGEDPLVLTTVATDCVTSLPSDGTDLGGAGDAAKNSFVIFWRLGTRETNMNTNTLLQNSDSPDRYSTNVFLTLVEH